MNSDCGATCIVKMEKLSCRKTDCLKKRLKKIEKKKMRNNVFTIFLGEKKNIFYEAVSGVIL